MRESLRTWTLIEVFLLRASLTMTAFDALHVEDGVVVEVWLHRYSVY